MRLVCFIIALFFVLHGQGQERMKFHHFTTQDGLAFNSVRCLFQDSKGFIWVGTDGGGLNRFDGYHFTVFKYDEDNPHSISNNQIYSIKEDQQGYLWVATHNGLNRFDANAGQFKRFYHEPGRLKSLRHNKITAIFIDLEHTLWVGTPMGLHKYIAQTEEFVNYYDRMTIHDQRPDKEISAIVDDQHGNLWLGVWWGGLKKFNKKTGQFTDFYADPTNPNSIHNNNVTSLFLDNRNILWIGNYLGGIRRMDIASETFMPVIDPENDAIVLGICSDHIGRIWYSRTGLGIINPSTGSFQLLEYEKNNAFGINSGNYQSVLCDKTGILWMGSDQGLSMYDAKREKFLSSYITNEHFKIETFYLNQERNILWLGTFKNGLIKYEQLTGKVTRFLPDHSLTNPFREIQTLCTNGKDELWIGTNNGIGIMDMKTEKIKKILYNNPKRPTLLNRVYGNTEFMWLINDNVRIFDLLRGKEYLFPTSGPLMLPCQKITNVVNYKDSNLWIGTVEGLSKFNRVTQKLEHYYNHLSDSTSISNKYILSIFQDSRKNIWIGTQNGLNRYNEKENNFERFTHHNSFASNYILNIKEDQHQNLWLFTDKGITKFNPDNGLVRNYEEKDGMDFGGQVFSDSKGWFYCTRKSEGYHVFHPDSIKDNPIIPPVYITRFLLFNKEVPVSTKAHKTPLETNISETREITLKHNQSYIGFEFVALNYTLPEKNKYAYQMEGFDKDWYYTDASHLSATYTNLNPGTYTFRVKASNNDGIWNDKGTAVKIIILPPFWKTSWAYLVYFMLIVGLIYLFRSYLLFQYKLKTRIEMERINAERMHEMDQMKLDFFGSISHEFRTPLTLISGPLDYCMERQTELNWRQDHQHFTMMKRNVDRLLHLVNKVLDIRKLDSGFFNIHLKNDDIIQFVKSSGESFNFKAEQKNIDFKILFHQPCWNTWFDPDLIDKIVFNLLSNAFKFTPEGGEISIETVILESGSQTWKAEKELHGFATSDDLVKIIVKDTGIGIPREQKEKVFDRFFQGHNHAGRSGGSGIGLALVKELIGLADGKIKLESQEGQGSSFMVWIPLGKDVAVEENNTALVQQFEPESTLDENPLPMVEPQGENHNGHMVKFSEKPLILIVEDNHDMEQFVSDILQSKFDILTAGNGKRGFELAMENIPDLIVSDIMMPDMDGLEMCQLIKNNERTNHIPIVLLTARSTEEYQIEGLFAGADDYIMKPFKAKNLLLRVCNIIKSRQLLREKFTLSTVAVHSEKPNSLDDAFINKIRMIVEKNLDNPDFDPQVFAEEIAMSRAQLYRKIKAITNQTVNDFIFSVRINKAAQLLLSGGLTISETAYAVGFKTPGHFSKMFNNHLGMSPSKYMEQHKAMI